MDNATGFLATILLPCILMYWYARAAIHTRLEILMDLIRAVEKKFGVLNSYLSTCKDLEHIQSCSISLIEEKQQKIGQVQLGILEEVQSHRDILSRHSRILEAIEDAKLVKSKHASRMWHKRLTRMQIRKKSHLESGMY